MHVIAGVSPGYHEMRVYDLDENQYVDWVVEANDETGRCVEFLTIGNHVAQDVAGEPMRLHTVRNILLLHVPERFGQ
jgi:hypothetical protein